MKSIFSHIIIFFSIVLLQFRQIQAASIVPQTSAIDSLFQSWNHSDTPGAALVIVKDAHVFYQAGYGAANLDYQIPITPYTVFDIASVAKPFTGMAVAMLMDQGQINLDADIRTYLNDFPKFEHPILVRNLRNHTSGLRDWTHGLALSGKEWSAPITQEDIHGFLSFQKRLNFIPGESDYYSSMGYHLLAKIVESVSKQNFGTWMEQEIFHPLGMHSTHVVIDPTTIVSHRATPYVLGEDGEYRREVCQLAVPGSSSVMSSVADLGKWLINFNTQTVGGKAVMDEMQTPARLSSGKEFPYGFGLMLNTYQGHLARSHGGAWGGYISAMIWLPNLRLGVGILANNAEINAENLVRRIVDLFLEPKHEDNASKNEAGSKVESAPEINVLSEMDLGSYVGDYWSEELRAVWHVKLADNRLFIGHGLNSLTPLNVKGVHEFQSEKLHRIGFPVSVEFQVNEDQSVSGLNLNTGHIRHLYFKRVDLGTLK